MLIIVFQFFFFLPFHFLTKGNKIMEEIKEIKEVLQGSTVDSMSGDQERDETLITINV